MKRIGMQYQRGVGRILLGAVGDTATTGQALVAYFTSNPCTQSFVQQVADFQTAWNTDGNNAGDQLVVDGLYGPLTQGALQNALGTSAVPANCYGGTTVTPQSTPQNQTIEQQTTRPDYTIPILVGAAAITAAFAAWTYSGNKHKRKRH